MVIIVGVGVIALIVGLTWKFGSRKFFLSRLAVLLGVFQILSSIAQAVQIATLGKTRSLPLEGLPLLGIQMIIGALAYRSLKKTKLGIKEKSEIRTVGEVTALFGMICLTVFGVAANRLSSAAEIMHIYPVESITAPIWSCIAYLTMWTRRPIGEETQDEVYETPGTLWHTLFSCEGRLERTAARIILLVIVLLNLSPFVVVVQLVFRNNVLSDCILVLHSIGAYVAIYPIVPIGIKRRHDREKRGWGLVSIFFVKGTEGPNRFGAVPSKFPFRLK